MTVDSPRVGILTGPTASGKTSLAVELSIEAGKVEIINADSMLVYRGLDVGTAKPTEKERQGIPHHLIDIRSPDDPFTAGDFVRAVRELITDIQKRRHRPLIVGGTGFYLKALLYGLWDVPKASPELRNDLERTPAQDLYEELLRKDPQEAYRIGSNDQYRLIRAIEMMRSTGSTLTELKKKHTQVPDPIFEVWIIDRPDSELHQRIQLRTREMIESGLIEETRWLRETYPSSRTLRAVGYEQTLNYLQGRTPEGRKVAPGLQGLQDEVNLATRQLVKRQRTWFRNQTPGTFFELDRDFADFKKEFLSLYPPLKN